MYVKPYVFGSFVGWAYSTRGILVIINQSRFGVIRHDSVDIKYYLFVVILNWPQVQDTISKVLETLLFKLTYP